MLVVRIELWKHGDEKQKTALQTIVIGNDGTGTDFTGNYRVWRGWLDHPADAFLKGWRRAGKAEELVRQALNMLAMADTSESDT